MRKIIGKSAFCERKRREKNTRAAFFCSRQQQFRWKKTLLFDSNIPSDIAILLKMLRVLFRRMRNSIYMQNVLFRERDRKNTRKFLIIYWSGSGIALFCIQRSILDSGKWCYGINDVVEKKMTMKQELELKLRWNFFHITYCHQALGENPFIPVDNLAAFLYNLH